ncbi:hypothetical protein HK097_010463, partial [Rhizophlyctis rosea]
MEVEPNPATFPSADEELLFSFLNQEYIGEPHSSPSYSHASYDPEGPPSPTMLFDTITTCSSPPHIASPPATVWSTESGTDSDGDNGNVLGKGLGSNPFLDDRVKAMGVSPFLEEDQLQDVPISAEDLQALIGIDSSAAAGQAGSVAPVLEHVGSGNMGLAGAPPEPVPTLDVTAVLQSTTAEVCQQLLTEPNRRKPGRKKKGESDPVTLPLDTDFHIPIKKEEEESSPPPQPAPLSLNFIPTQPFHFVVPKHETNPISTPTTTIPPSIPTFIQIPTLPHIIPSAPAPVTTPKDPAALAAAKRHERMIKNREAADQSRKRKREHLQLLEAHAASLIKENELLKRKVVELEERNKSLVGENERLRRGHGGVGGVVPPPAATDGFRVHIDQSAANGMPLAMATGMKRKSTDTPAMEPPNKKAVGAVFMVFLFSFAMLFFPGTTRPHLGNHIAGKAFSSYSLDDAVAARRYIEAHPYHSLSSVRSLPSDTSLIPFALPSATVDSTYLNLPLDNGNFTELLDVLSRDEGLSRRGRAQVARLREMFVEGGREGKVKVPVASTIRKLTRRSVGRDVARAGNEIVQKQNTPIQLGPADWSLRTTEGHHHPITSVAMTDLIRLMPYRSPFSLPSQPSRQCSRICTDESGRLVDEAVVGEYPRLSLLASLPGGSADGREGFGTEWE